MVTISILQDKHIIMLDFSSFPGPVCFIDGIKRTLSESKRLSLKATIEDALDILQMQEDEIPASLID